MTKKKAASGMLAGLALAMLGGSRALAANPVDATITVTPVAAVSIELSPTAYPFGNVDIAISTNSDSALTLSNAGTVNVAVEKKIQSQGGWTAGAAAGVDAYVLYCATAAARPDLAEFLVHESSTSFGAEGNVTDLFGIGGGAPVLTTSGGDQSVDLWFRLDMPTAVTSQTGQTITARFTATAQ